MPAAQPKSSTQISSKNNIVHYLTWALKLALAGVFLYSSYAKIIDLYTFGEILRSYGILPDALIKPMAVVLPMLEALFGIGLLIPKTARISAVVIGILSLFFLVALAANWGKVLPFGCGCFGPTEAKPVGWMDVGKDVLFIAMAAGVYPLRRK